MKYSQIKQIKKFCDGLFSEPDWKEVISNSGEDDFTVGDVRFISDASIDSIQCDELENDTYILGCFNSWFIADVLGIDEDVIIAMQKADAFDAIGKLIISMGKLEELQQAYVSADGYGHHFNSWDGGEEEITIDGQLYHVFDNH